MWPKKTEMIRQNSHYQCVYQIYQTSVPIYNLPHVRDFSQHNAQLQKYGKLYLLLFHI